MKKTHETVVLKNIEAVEFCETDERVIYLIDDGCDRNIIADAQNSVIIDLKNESIIYFGEEYKMRSMEHKLLSYFLDNSDRTISKDELYREVWGYIIVAGDSSTLTVHINRLRDKLGYDLNKFAVIQTVWGVGYKLCGEFIKRIPRDCIK